MGGMSKSLEDDLRERWRPGAAQIAAADELLAVGVHPATEGVFTGHLLVNKHFGFWTRDVTVLTLDDGIFSTRETCSAAVRRMAEATCIRLGVPVTGGYTWHVRPGEWAVFEDIMAVFEPDLPSDVR